MRAERQQGNWYQRRLFGDGEEPLRLGQGSEGGIRSSRFEESQPLAALEQTRTLTCDLMRRICHRDNLNQAYRKVTANKGGPGIDGMTVDDLSAWLALHKDKLIASLLDGTYQPQPVRGVEIPKPVGGARQLGIPTLKERALQCLVKLALEPEWEAVFEPNSYGFRPGRSVHDATVAVKHGLGAEGCGRKDQAPRCRWILDADIKSGSSEE